MRLTPIATSVDIERGFSHGGLTVSKRRHNLSDDSIRAAVVLNAWFKIPGLVPENKLLTIFRDQNKRQKPDGAASSSTTVIDVDDDE